MFTLSVLGPWKQLCLPWPKSSVWRENIPTWQTARHSSRGLPSCFLSIGNQPFIHKGFQEAWCWSLPKWTSFLCLPTFDLGRVLPSHVQFNKVHDSEEPKNCCMGLNWGYSTLWTVLQGNPEKIGWQHGVKDWMPTPYPLWNVPQLFL